jgi:hypothetical protein
MINTLTGSGPERSKRETRRGGYIAKFSENLSAYPDYDVTGRQRISTILVKHRVWREGRGEEDRYRRHKVASSLRETSDCA